MPRIFCVHCGIPVVIDPQGRCPEGHVLDSRTAESGAAPGEPGRAHDASAAIGPASGDPDRTDLEDALRAVWEQPASTMGNGSGSAPHGDSGSAAHGDSGSAALGDSGSAALGDEPEPWVGEVGAAEGEADTDGEAGTDAAPQGTDVSGREASHVGDPDPVGRTTSDATDPNDTVAIGDGLDLFDELGTLEAPDTVEVAAPPVLDTSAPDARRHTTPPHTTPPSGSSSHPAPPGTDDEGDDDLAFLFDTGPHAGPAAAHGAGGDPAALTQPIPISTTIESPRTAAPESTIDPTNFTSRGGRVEEIAAGGRGWRARLTRRRVS